MSHMRNVRRRSKVAKRQKNRLTFDILPLCLAPAIRSSLRMISGVRVVLCCVTELLWELIEPLSIASAAILICLSSSAILPIHFWCRCCNVNLQKSGIYNTYVQINLVETKAIITLCFNFLHSLHFISFLFLFLKSEFTLFQIYVKNAVVCSC